MARFLIYCEAIRDGEDVTLVLEWVASSVEVAFHEVAKAYPAWGIKGVKHGNEGTN